MAYQMTITLTDDEYAALSAEASRTGKPVEILVHEALQMRAHSDVSQPRRMTGREFAAKLYREGKIMNLPTREPLTPGEIAERERLAQKLGQGKPLSEMVIEDRGPKEVM